jgi:hypothetical protein
MAAKDARGRNQAQRTARNTRHRLKRNAPAAGRGFCASPPALGQAIARNRVPATNMVEFMKLMKGWTTGQI